MTLLADLGDRLVAQSVGALADDIWLGGLPDGPDITADPYVALIELTGLPPGAVMGTAADPLRNPRVQLIGRGSGYAAVRALVQSAIDALELTDTTINTTRYLLIEAVDEPASLGTDPDGRWRVAANMQVTREK